MREFIIQVELDKNGTISNLSKQNLIKLCDYIQDTSLRFVWIFSCKTINAHSVRSIVRFERKHCTFKRLTVHNCIVSSNCKVSFWAKHLMSKYKFSLKNQNDTEIEADYIRMCFGNEPKSCTFNSCLGKYVFIDISGALGICPIIKNDIKLNDALNIQSIYDIFNSETFISVLKDTIEHRKDCKNNCEHFPLCKGGCPLTLNRQTPDNCKVKESISCIREKMAGLTMTDPCLREQVIVKTSNMYRI